MRGPKFHPTMHESGCGVIHICNPNAQEVKVGDQKLTVFLGYRVSSSLRLIWVSKGVCVWRDLKYGKSTCSLFLCVGCYV